MKACLLEAAEMAGWDQRDTLDRQPAPHLRREIGMATIIFTVGLGRNIPDSAGADLEMAADGSVLLLTGAGRYGTGDPYCPGANLCRSIRD